MKNFLDQLSRSKFATLAGWAISTFLLVLAGGLLVMDRQLLGWIAVIMGATLIQLNAYFERKIFYSEGKIEGYRALIAEVAERQRGMEQRP